MKRLLLISALILIAFCSFYYFSSSSEIEEQNIESLREQHLSHLENSPFKETQLLSKEERKNQGLPPNAHNERLWELTMDPSTGRPMPERLFEIQERLNRENQGDDMRGVGGDGSNPWIDRGPNNIGGRTRGIMFDPTDGTNKRVFAGGVSGGLWVNNDITNANSSWTLVAGAPNNISVNIIISDPNNASTFYIGSGESYTSGQAVGRGIWKSADAGVTWSNIWFNPTGVTGGQLIEGEYYINDIVARDIGGGNTELYAAVTGAFYRYIPTGQWHGLNQQGIYKSTNGGTSWTKENILESGVPVNPNDIELDSSNNIWFSTTTNSWNTALPATIYRSTTGAFGSFTLMHTFAAGTGRVEIEPSQMTAGTFWILANQGGVANIFTTTNDFTNVTQILTEPNDADLGIPAADFTRTAPWYNLTIEADSNDNLIVGGIDLFRSTDNGATWAQISKWSNNANLHLLTCSFVHADQHSTIFRPGSGENEVVFGTDGGVFYCSDLANAGTTATIAARNKDYNTTQFYYGTIDQSGGGNGDDIMGGMQDNGTFGIQNAIAGANAYSFIRGGDGAYTEVDDASGYLLDAYVYNSHGYKSYPGYATSFTIATADTGGGSPMAIGNFINEAALDKNLDILYSNGSIVGTSTWRLERIAEFIPGAPAQVNTFLSNALLNDNITAMKVSPHTLGSTTLLVGLRSGVLLKVTNADTTPVWSSIGTFTGSISDIEFGVGSEMEIYVTMHNYGITSIHYTSNGGGAWFGKEGNLPDVPVKCILQNPLIPNEVIIGTELGVWATGDFSVGAPSWVQTQNGMKDVTVVDLDVRTSDNVILASTHGRGQFTSQFTSSPLSVTEHSFDSSTISIYPTVNDGQFTISTKRALGNVSFQLYNISGQRVFDSNFELNDLDREFNLNLNSGIYLAKISNNGYSITKRIIIK